MQNSKKFLKNILKSIRNFEFILIYHIFHFLTIRELIKIPKINKIFYNSFKKYSKLWEEELKKLSEIWKFKIDKIDPNRDFANYVQRKYEVIESPYETRRITKNSIFLITSAFQNTSNKNFRLKIINDGAKQVKVKYFDFLAEYSEDYFFTNVLKGKYKLFLRCYREYISMISQKISIYLLIEDKEKILLDKIEFTTKQYCELSQSKNVTNSQKEKIQLNTIFITELDLFEVSSKESVNILINLSKNGDYFSGWYLSELILEKKC